MQPVTDPAGKTVSPQSAPAAPQPSAPDPLVTAFVCANCARPGRTPTSAGRQAPAAPMFAWPFAAREVLVPCTGRLQPEHLLKAFEKGADAIVVVACEEANCHYLEGSRRALRRIDFVRGLIEEMGLGGARLMMYNLPGSAREDMNLGADQPAPALSDEDLARRIAAVRDDCLAKLKNLPPNPLRSSASATDLAAASYEEADLTDDDNEE
jgi:coenzyme F420-reducing hydrogenase delta subunit